MKTFWVVGVAFWMVTGAFAAGPKVTAVKKETVDALQGLEKVGPCKDRRYVYEQSFQLEAPGTPQDGSLFLATECMDSSPKFFVAEFRKGAFYQQLPPHHANDWSVFEVQAMTFRDVNGDGSMDIVGIASAASGIGPEGAKDFPVASVWLGNADGTFKIDEKVQPVLEKLKTVTLKTVFPALKKFYGTK